MKDFILYKLLRRKKQEVQPEPEKVDILATLYMKDGRVQEILGFYHTSKEFVEHLAFLCDLDETFYSLTTDNKRIMLRGQDVKYAIVETEKYEA